MVDVMLDSLVPMSVVWGPARILLYNDSYVPFLGDKHPRALGMPLEDVWPEVWGEIGPLVVRARNGESFHMQDLLLTIQRNGRPDNAYFTFYYSPLRDEHGACGSMYSSVVETTDRVRAEQRQAFLLSLSDALGGLTDPQEILRCAATMLGRHLDVARMVFSEIDLPADRIRFHSVFDDRGQAPVEGESALGDWGTDHVAALVAGRSICIEDIESDPTLSEELRQRYRRVGARACIAAPVLDTESRLFLLGASADQPRAWGSNEIELLEETARRTRSAVEQARAADAIRRLNESLEARVEQRTVELEQARRDARAAQDEARRRWRLYETVLGSTPDLVYVFDLEHRFTYVNPGLLRMWGRTFEESIGRTCLELGYPDRHAQLHAREIDEVIATRASVRGVVPFEGTLGRRQYDCIFEPVFGSDGEVEAVASTTGDVTELKQSEEEAGRLLAMERTRSGQLRRVAEIARETSTVLDDGVLSDRLVHSVREIIGAHQAVVSLSDGENWNQIINAVSLSDKYARWSEYIARPDGTGIYAWVCQTNQAVRMTQAEFEAHPRWKGFGAHAEEHPPMRGWLVVPMIGQGGRNLGVIQLSDKFDGEFTEDDEAIVVQLAAIAAAGIENARLYEQLREQDRRKDEFLATLAHELRNPLAPIRTGLGVLRLAPTGDDATRVRGMIERQVGHMVRLIDDLLDVSRITRGKVQLQRQRLDVRTIVDDALELARDTVASSGHELALALPPRPLHVQADPTRMSQVLGNLLNNAAKYTPRGGRIELSVREDGSEVVIEVSDTGVGLAPESIDRVFELFSQVGKTLDRSQGGLGIGLALVKRLVEMHDGRVDARSSGLGHGSAFTVPLPLAADTAGDDSTFLDVPGAAPGDARLSVLVIDDNEDAATTLAMLLGLHGHAVQVGHDANAALAAVQAQRFDIAFLDIGLPGVDGYELASMLRGLASRPPHLVAVTGWGAEQDRQRASDSGFDQHLTKPVDPARLQRLVTEVAEGSSPKAARAVTLP